MIIVQKFIKFLLIIQLTNYPVSGENAEMDLVSSQSKVIINQQNVQYAINSDGSYQELIQLEMGLELYATYLEKDIVHTSQYYDVYSILALYTYNPRT